MQIKLKKFFKKLILFLICVLFIFIIFNINNKKDSFEIDETIIKNKNINDLFVFINTQKKLNLNDFLIEINKLFNKKKLFDFKNGKIKITQVFFEEYNRKIILWTENDIIFKIETDFKYYTGKKIKNFKYIRDLSEQISILKYYKQLKINSYSKDLMNMLKYFHKGILLEFPNRIAVSFLLKLDLNNNDKIIMVVYDKKYLFFSNRIFSKNISQEYKILMDMIK